MANQVNSFTETVNNLVEQVNIALEFSVATNESLSTQNDTVDMYVEEKDPITGDPSIITYQIPSYNTMINKVNLAVDSMDTFIKGNGKVLLNDGTFREVKTIPVAVSPPQILDVNPPTQFTTRNNWFFESLIFPQLTVSFDLKNKIDDRSDRIVVRRIIFDNSSDEETQWFLDNIIGQELSYYDTVSYLTKNAKRYWLDDETHDLPLYTEQYTGYFNIINKRTIDEKEWYILDTLNYGIPSDEPVLYNIQLEKGSFLRYNNSIYKISDVNVAESRVQLISMIGMDKPGVNSQFEIYSAPFSSKIAQIPVGYDECNIMFIKGVNDDYNLLADDWSLGIPFYTNELILEYSTTTLEEYYNLYVSDFGKKMQAEAKERLVPAYFGLDPNVPVLDADAFTVSQINTQLNAALDTEEVKNTQTQIESTKTIINSLKSTIAQQKADLVNLRSPGLRDNLNAKISNNISDLSKRTIEYQSLVRSLTTLAYESDAVNATPKYKLRGFFDIPQAKQAVDSAKPQEIIQFEISYRYLKLDNSGTELNTYQHTDSEGRVKRGVFTDWINVMTPIKERVYDTSKGSYEWVNPDIADGEINNINQVDIPIRTGEKVEFRVRSISEAGWPTNARKSEWSESIIKEFPANLSSSDQVTNILNDAITEESNIQIEETLNAYGLETHLADSIPNPNSGDGTFFKHQAVNLSYDLSRKDKTNLKTETVATDIQSQFDNIPLNSYVTITKPSGATSTEPQITGTLQQFLQAIVNIDPSIYDEFDDIVPNPTA